MKVFPCCSAGVLCQDVLSSVSRAEDRLLGHSIIDSLYRCEWREWSVFRLRSILPLTLGLFLPNICPAMNAW